MTYDDTIRTLFKSCPPISHDKLKGVKKIITHGGKCPDGKASAMILNAAYQGSVPIEFVVHGSREHKALKPEPGLLFCDFCVPEDNWRDFLEAGTIVLDHHKGVKSVVQAFVAAGQGVFADEVEHPGVSGATLAYEYVWKPLATNEAVTVSKDFGRLAGIRDTWQTSSPDWVEACQQAEALSWWPNEHLLEGSVSDWDKFLELGPILWDKKTRTAQKVAEASYRFVSKGGTRVAMFQGMRLSSDVAEVLDDQVDLVIGYDLEFADGQFKQGFSTRSHTHYDCKSFAKAHGGGGHTKAAGFGVPLKVGSAPNPYKVAEIILNAYEGDIWAFVRKLFL